MDKKIVFALGLLIGGVTTGVVMATSSGPAPVPDSPANQPAEQSAAPNPLAPIKAVSVDTGREKSSEDDSTLDAILINNDTLTDVLSRLEQVEARITVLELTLADTPTQPSPADVPSPDEMRTTLLQAGFADYTVNEILKIRNAGQLERLDLRDRATREGWIGTDQFINAMRELRRTNPLRSTLGDDDYDRLLVAEGRNNRVRIDNIMENSAAAEAGIESGDIVIDYAGERIFSVAGLRQATTEGERNEPVSIQIIRGSTLLDLIIARGPMGVTISPVVQPEPP